MSGLAFDTLKYTKRLREVGVPEPQAEVQAELLAEALADRLASKEDLTRVEKQLDAKIESTKAELQRDIKELDAKIESTKAELQRDIKELDAKIASTKTELQRDIANVEAKIEASKADTIKWTAGMFAAQTALIIGAMFAVMRPNQPPPQLPVAQEMRVPAPPLPGQGSPAQVR
ncbi:MAG: DUF1640 domain-containing protein [Magnetococcales bacterium]|nr:DUF1640 domain-containing protein [Magnetococcales bacterium]